MSENSQADMVLAGRDGVLFLQNDSNRVIEQIEGRFPIRDNDLFAVAMAHASRRSYLETMSGAQYHHILIPNKEVVFASHLPPSVAFEGFGRRPYSRYQQIDATHHWRPYYQPDVLRRTEPRRSFPLTDTHWNHHGATDYLTAFLAAAEPYLANSFSQVPLREFGSEQLGDLGGKVGLPKEPITIVSPSHPRASLVFDNGAVNEGRVRYYANKSLPVRRRAVILHDSFGDWLLSLIAELFSDVLFIHGPDFDFEFVSRFRPDYVWFFQIERFFVRLPKNGTDWIAYIAGQEQRKQSKAQFLDFIKETKILDQR
ncbi:hypothetical protein [Microvirga sp. P5_D2]